MLQQLKIYNKNCKKIHGKKIHDIKFMCDGYVAGQIKPSG